MNKRRFSWVALLLAAALLLTSGCSLGDLSRYLPISGTSQLLQNAEQSEAQGQYDYAMGAYAEALKVDENNVPARLGLARCSLYKQDAAAARNYLRDVRLSPDDPMYGDYLSLKEFAEFSPEYRGADTSYFPQVAQEFRYESALQLTKDDIEITENGQKRDVTDLQMENGTLRVFYATEDTNSSGEARKVEITIRKNGFSLVCDGDYSTPVFQDADLRLVSTDVSNYPIVKAYFRVEDPRSGESVEHLGQQSFRILERLQGGEYLSREIHSVSVLEGHEGLNIGLVADKSDSIYYADMQKIKSVMTEFVNNLHFSVGDRAEVLAFDSIVQQMCSFTNNPQLLISGISSMSPDGMTALYDAIYVGINHSMLQGGARCVVAFTDGQDNVSYHSAAEVIRYANQSQVPVYIIGVGNSIHEDTLRSIARETGGRYWYIDDLYDLRSIFDLIYANEKQLYAVEYVSDAGIDAYSDRTIDVTVSGSGYRTDRILSFASPRPPKRLETSSRYEAFNEALTWEEASQRCQDMGGHLATITSASEENQIIRLAESRGLRYVWLGGYTSHDEYGRVFAHWVTGEVFSYANWSIGEPSRADKDGTPEWYIMLWNIPRLGGWTWNDQRNNPLSVNAAMKSKMGYICEFEEFR